MNTSDVLATFGRDAPQELYHTLIDACLYGPWFRLMIPETDLSDEQLAKPTSAN